MSGLSVLDAALAYQRLGFAVLPLMPGEKRPHHGLIRATRHSSWALLREQPASIPEIREWFRRDPKANLGIITGAASGGLVVADFDDRRPERLIDTPTVQTGRGLHVYLRSSAPITSQKVHGFELKGEGGYVVAPPSVHPSDERYQWLISPTGLGHLSLPEAHLAELENWELVAAVAEQGSSGQASSNPSLLDVTTEVPTGSRGGELGWLESFDADPQPVAAMCGRLGIPYLDGTGFH